VAGVQMPFTVRVSSVSSRSSYTRTFTEIRADVQVDAGKFAKPTT
jgi:hypothetical protein